MEKLLHERLREWSKTTCPLNTAFSRLNIDEYSYDDEVKKLFTMFADEIERYYIPREQHEAEVKQAALSTSKPLKWFMRGIQMGEDWPEPKEGESFRAYLDRVFIPRPRFEDGEPVVKGSETDFGTVWSVGARDDGYWQLFDEDGCEFSYGEKGDFVKRPTPKVYDADGVEIKVGDTVYIFDPYDMTVSEEPVTVKEVINDGVCPLIYTNEMGECGYGAGMLTHERPVFDAEGVRIRKGDAVWHVGDASRGTVVGIIMDDTWHGYPVKVAWDKGDEGFYQGDALTHREPDSPERIIHDICEYCKLGSTDTCDAAEFLAKIADRAALIERSA